MIVERVDRAPSSRRRHLRARIDRGEDRFQLRLAVVTASLGKLE